MSDEKALKEQRDRFVAFAFAGADLFIEVSEDGKIIHVTGAAKSMTGIDHNALLKRNWLELFSAYEQAKMTKAREDATPGARIGPTLVALNEQIGQRMAVLSAIRMPQNGRFYLSLGVSNEFIAKIAPLVGLPGSNGFIDRDRYADAARDAVFDAKLWGQDVVLTFFDFVSADDMQKRFGKDGWGKVEDLIGQLMAQYSFGGYTAGQITEGRYSFVHDKSINIDDIKTKIVEIAKAHGVEISLKDLEAKTIAGDLQDISKKDLSRAVDHTIKQFETSGTALEIGNLKQGFDSYMSANEAKVREFKSIIERVSFTQLFHPIVNIRTRELTHYEILSKFESGNTQEWIRFGEDAGLAPDFDLAVLERAINHIKFKAGGTRVKYSIDISSQSVADDDFFEKMKEQLGKNKGMHERLSFEITESANIEDLAKAASFVKELQKDGFKIALDDFHPSAAVPQYLQNIKADFVKIDGKYIGRILSSPRDAALIRNLVEMCQDAGVEPIAESVESKEQADLLVEMGVKYAQGYLYAQPSAKPDYIAAKA